LCLISFFLLLAFARCTPAPPEELPPREIVHRAVDRMKAMQGFHFVIDRSGAPAFLDSAGSLVFRRAEGDFSGPDRATAKIRVIGPGIVTEVQIVSIGVTQWETHFLTGEWVELPPNWGFNPATLFDAQIGIQPILERELQDLALRGIEELPNLPGERFYALTGRLTGEGLYALSYGMIGPKEMDIELWVAPETFELHQLRITHEAADADEPTIWLVEFWDFDGDFDIHPPIEPADASE
jgi:hypothetical protein